MTPLGQAFEICSSRAHGHVQAVSLAMQRLGLASLFATVVRKFGSNNNNNYFGVLKFEPVV